MSCIGHKIQLMCILEILAQTNQLCIQCHVRTWQKCQINSGVEKYLKSSSSSHIRKEKIWQPILSSRYLMILMHSLYFSLQPTWLACWMISLHYIFLSLSPYLPYKSRFHIPIQNSYDAIPPETYSTNYNSLILSPNYCLCWTYHVTN